MKTLDDKEFFIHSHQQINMMDKKEVLNTKDKIMIFFEDSEKRENSNFLIRIIFNVYVVIRIYTPKLTDFHNQNSTIRIKIYFKLL